MTHIERPQRLTRPVAPGSLLKRLHGLHAIARTRPAESDRDESYLDAIRALPCLHCGMEPSEAAHVRFASAAHGKASGLGKKPADKWAAPLCAEHHRLARDAQHKRNEREFWYALGIPILDVCERLYAQRDDPVAMRAVVMCAIAERGLTTV